jgi:ABC-type amino acid transport substrate-binding protein
LLLHWTLFGAGAAWSLPATAGSDSLRVGVKASPPFVQIDPESGEVGGFSIELMQLIAARLEPPVALQFLPAADIDAHVAMVAAGSVDLGIAALTITSERERLLDFSQPFYRAGLDIAVRGDKRTSAWDVLRAPELYWTLLWLGLFLLTAGHLIWFAERGSDAFSDYWLRGVGQGVWWTIVTMSTVGYGDFVPKKPTSRLLAVVVIFTGIVLFGVAVASFSSVMTLQRLQSAIHGPGDLRGQTVAVVRASVAQQEMQERGARVRECADLDAALALLRGGEVAAVVHDAPLLRRRLRFGEEGLSLVGPAFAERGYGIAFPSGSPLRETVDVILLRLLEEPQSPYDELIRRWFGGAPS